MESFIGKLSSINPRELSVDDKFTLKKLERYYQGGYSFVFYNAFSKIRDFKYKNHTAFYLTDDLKQTEIFDNTVERLKVNNILTPLKFGGNFLSFKVKDPRDLGDLGVYNDYDYYGDHTFSTEKTENTNFVIEIKPDNVCNIYYLYKHKKYYLTENGSDVNLYTSKSGLSGTDFNYIYSESNDSICLFRNTGSDCRLLIKSGNKLKMVGFDNDNKILAPLHAIKIERPLYTDVNNIENFSVVGYDTSNTIPKDLIEKNLSNNYLIHSVNDDAEVIVLKNQLTQNDIFTSGNTLISSNFSPFFVKEMRDYTSILNDINSENDESLGLNYVFYNKSYTIKPCKNVIYTPNNLSPFNKININDTKFVDCGAFSHNIPLYADKIYRVDNDNGYNDGQFYLCTWLSGSPMSDNKVWVDRYYYPDVVEKKNALISNSTFNITYENLIENLIIDNNFIQNSLSSFQIFDKKSDFVIKPNDVFIYERLNSLPSKLTTDELSVCGVQSINYFEKINDQGMFTLFLQFEGDYDTWTFNSDRNNIDGGLEISKNIDDITITLKLFNPSNGDVVIFKESGIFKKLKNNTVTISIDTIKGIGYFNLNSGKLLDIEFDKFQFYGKKILFGDFISNSNIKNMKIFTSFIDFDESLMIPYINGDISTNDITVTLPCGKRNSEDEIDLLQSVCANQTFKSNHVNISVKGVDVPQRFRKDLEKIIKDTCYKYSTVTTEINNIEFE